MTRRWLADMREGGRILTTRDFWRTFRTYWSGEAVAGRMEAWVERQKRRP